MKLKTLETLEWNLKEFNDTWDTWMTHETIEWHLWHLNDIWDTWMKLKTLEWHLYDTWATWDTWMTLKPSERLVFVFSTDPYYKICDALQEKK